jgi:hypothetical protein
MVRIDIEGHEYNVLANDVPDQIETICLELHVFPPYDKTKAVKLLRNMGRQGFKLIVFVKEMEFGYYPLINSIGLKAAYKLATSSYIDSFFCPCIQTKLSLDEITNALPEYGAIHILLKR